MSVLNSLSKTGKKLAKKQLKELLEAKSAGAHEPWNTLRKINKKLEEERKR